MGKNYIVIMYILLWVKFFIVRWYGIVIIKIKKIGVLVFFFLYKIKRLKIFVLINYVMLWEKKIDEENK